MIVAVIPCFNEEKTIGKVVQSTKQYVDTVFVADDCSTDNTVFAALDSRAKVTYNSEQFKGAGGATRQGIMWAKLTDKTHIVVTIDGDGQHNPNEIPKLLEASKQADLVIGSRFLGDYKLPRYRKIGIDIITWLYNFGHKQKIKDAQSCFRTYSREILDSIKITENGFAFSVELLVKARAKGFKIVEVPVECIYHSDFKMNSSLNPVKHGVLVALAVIKWRVKLEVMPKVKTILFVVFKAVARKLVGHGLGGIRPLARLYVLMCSWLLPKDSLTVPINGYLMNVDRRKIDGITQRVYFEGAHEPITTSIFNKLIKEGNNVIDVGANIGYFTLLASKLVGNTGHVWAVEPEPVNLKDLQKNIELNKFTNIDMIPKAASKANGKAELFLSSMESGAHSLVRIPKDLSRKIEIETVRLDDVIGNKKIDFIKSDAEGHDVSVLLGAENIIQNNKDIKLIVEFLLPGVSSPEYTCEQFWTLLEHYFNFKYIYVIDEIQKFIKPSTLELAKQCYSKYKLSVNLLCSRSEVMLDENIKVPQFSQVI